VYFVFVEATSLYLLLNKPHLFSLTQHTFILIQLISLTCIVICFGLYVGSPKAFQYENFIKEDIIKIYGPLFYIHYLYNVKT